MRKNRYISPQILAQAGVELESVLLASVVDAFNAGGVDTQAMPVESIDMADENFYWSHSWED
jgi:hypothetical protein